jgi:hypothetical protein
MRLRAFSSMPVSYLSAHDISSVWRFGSDPRHLTNNGAVNSCVRCVVRNLQRTQISSDPGTNKWREVLHTHTKTWIHA